MAALPKEEEPSTNEHQKTFAAEQRQVSAVITLKPFSPAPKELVVVSVEPAKSPKKLDQKLLKRAFLKML